MSRAYVPKDFLVNFDHLLNVCSKRTFINLSSNLDPVKRFLIYDYSINILMILCLEKIL